MHNPPGRPAAPCTEDKRPAEPTQKMGGQALRRIYVSFAISSAEEIRFFDQLKYSSTFFGLIIIAALMIIMSLLTAILPMYILGD